MAIAWTNGPRVNGTNWVRSIHFTEIVNRINKLRALEFLGPDSTLPTFVGDTGVVWTPGVYELRNAYPGIIVGPDATPAAYSMRWLNSSGSPINISTTPPGGEVSFFSLLNGGTNWTAGGGIDGWIGVVDLNELRAGLELLTHGLWKFPAYFDGGLFSPLPTMPWFGGSVAKNSSGQELRTAGFVNFSVAGTPLSGLTNVTVRGSSKIWVTGSAACSVEVGRITMPLTVSGGVSRTWGVTWNSPWGSPGGDFAAIGSASLTAGTPAAISGVGSGLQSMIDGGPSYQNFLLRRTDTGSATVSVSVTVDVEFDLID